MQDDNFNYVLQIKKNLASLMKGWFSIKLKPLAEIPLQREEKNIKPFMKETLALKKYSPYQPQVLR